MLNLETTAGEGVVMSQQVCSLTSCRPSSRCMMQQSSGQGSPDPCRPASTRSQTQSTTHTHTHTHAHTHTESRSQVCLTWFLQNKSIVSTLKILKMSPVPLTPDISSFTVKSTAHSLLNAGTGLAPNYL